MQTKTKNKAKRIVISALAAVMLLCVCATPLSAATITGGTLLASYPTSGPVGSYPIGTPIYIRLPDGTQYDTGNKTAWIDDVPVMYLWVSPFYMVSASGQDISSQYYLSSVSGLGRLLSDTPYVVCNLGSRTPTPTKSGGIYLDGSFRSAAPGTMKSGYGVFGRVNLDTRTYNLNLPYYQRELVSAEVTATYSINRLGTWYTDGLAEQRVTVTMEQTSPNVYQLPVNTNSHYNYRKVYIPVAWPDGQYYTVTFNIKVVYRDRIKTISRCCETIAGQLGVCGSSGSNNFLVFDKSWWNAWETKTQTYQITNKILVNGNMYQDDFSGDRL